MGLSASQARFLQLTARKSNVEFEAQQITFQRLMLSDKMSEVSSQYQDKTSNMKMTFAFNDGTGTSQIDISYNNYKNYINQQQEGITTTLNKMFLVSSSGNKIIVANEEDRQKMIDLNSTKFDKTQVDAAVEAIKAAQETGDDSKITEEQRELAQYANYPITTEKKDDGTEVEYYTKSDFKESDFLIVEDLDDVDSFQRAIKEGIYFFAEFNSDAKENEPRFQTKGWDTLGGGAISEIYDTTDDAAAQAEYDNAMNKIQKIDKKLELRLDQLNSERSAIEQEIESVSKVIDDNIEKSFDAFS